MPSKRQYRHQHTCKEIGSSLPPNVNKDASNWAAQIVKIPGLVNHWCNGSYSFHQRVQFGKKQLIALIVREELNGPLIIAQIENQCQIGSNGSHYFSGIGICQVISITDGGMTCSKTSRSIHKKQDMIRFKEKKRGVIIQKKKD